MGSDTGLGVGERTLVSFPRGADRGIHIVLLVPSSSRAAEFAEFIRSSQDIRGPPPGAELLKLSFIQVKLGCVSKHSGHAARKPKLISLE